MNMLRLPPSHTPSFFLSFEVNKTREYSSSCFQETGNRTIYTLQKFPVAEI